MKRQTVTVTSSILILLVTVILAILATYATPALADYEQLAEHFGVSGEAEQLDGAFAIAINATGAGGVEPGSLYIVGHSKSVLRYGPGKQGEEPPFKEAWGWGVGDGKEEYERCGPALTTEPAQHTYHTCANVSYAGEGIGELTFEVGGVAIDAATGYVYVRNAREPGRRKHLIAVFTATGIPVGEGFGEQGRQLPFPSESIAEGPEKLHEQGPSLASFEDLAVDDTGVVYVTDHDFNEIADPSLRQTRIMSFAPEHPGDYEHYVYTGEAKDITASRQSVPRFARLALIGSDRLVAADEESIFEYALGGGSTPVCSYHVSGQLWGMTANPITGEVFYYSNSDGEVHRLGACDPSTATFDELQGPVSVTPATQSIAALAVNPSLSWGPLRPEGVLYAVDPHEHKEGSSVQRGIGDIIVPAKVSPPTTVSESVAGTTVDSTFLRAEVNPNGFTTTYHFQYLTGTVYAERKARAEGEGKTAAEAVEAAFAGTTEVPVGGGTLQPGAVGIAEAGVAGLQPDTEYRFRVVASSDCEGAGSGCVVKGETASFTTYPAISPGLVDGRGYELVSPPEKNGGEVFPADPEIASCSGGCKPDTEAQPARFPIQSAPDGDSVVYMGGPFSAGEGDVTNEYISKRTAAGWQTSDLSPALQNPRGSGSVVFDTGLGKDLVDQEASPQLTTDAPAGYENLYLQDTNTPGGLEPLIVNQPPNRSPGAFRLEFAGASLDLSRAFFSANDALSEETPFVPQPPDPGTFGRDLYEWHEGALTLVNVAPGNTSVVEGAKFASATGASTLSPDAHAVSSDGSRVFWSAGGAVYVRVNGQETLEVADGGFETASADGSEVLLTDGRLYRYSQENGVYEQVRDLAEGQGGFQGILGSGEEGDQLARVYFIDTQALSGSGVNERGQAAQPGGDNLYVWETGAARYITTLVAATDNGQTYTRDWSASPVDRTAEASPDGRWVAFKSKAQLSGYGNHGPCEWNADGTHLVESACTEVFLYDSTSGRLSCVSCNPAGEAPRGPSTLPVNYVAYVGHEWFSQLRYLTDTGRLVFDSGDRLSAADSNGRVEDVYEYEPEGVGSCTRPAGCVVLISPGTGSVDSNFLAMDETGANIFFTTRERLVPQDRDELVDVYDAREQGGFSSQTETQRSECQGEACQATPSPPVFAFPGSASFSGAGNLLQPLPVSPTAKQGKAKTRASSRTKRLEKCRRDRSKRRRVACERRARKKGARNARNAQQKKSGGAR